jgi:hypothetical protein
METSEANGLNARPGVVVGVLNLILTDLVDFSGPYRFIIESPGLEWNNNEYQDVIERPTFLAMYATPEHEMEPEVIRPLETICLTITITNSDGSQTTTTVCTNVGTII